MLEFYDPLAQVELPPLIVNPVSIKKTLWNTSLVFLIMFLAITVPYRIAFEENAASQAWVFTDISIDFLFIIDVVLNFLTAYEDENGVLVVEKTKIAKVYLKSWLIPDLLSSIPLSLVSEFTNMDVSNLKFVKLSRLPRLYRLLRLIKLLRFYKSNRFIDNMLRDINIS